MEPRFARTRESGGFTHGDHVGGDVADTAGPALGGLVENVVHADAGVLLGQGIEILLEEDVLGGDVGEDEVDLGAVTLLTAADDGADDLEHGGDAGAASDHAKVTDHVGGVDECALGAADADALADDERGHVLGDVALGVGLDEEVEVAGLVVTGDGGVGADDFLCGAIGLLDRGADGDVLADGEAENRGLCGELESVAEGAGWPGQSLDTGIELPPEQKNWQAGREIHSHGYIVGDDCLLCELKLLERVGLENRYDSCGVQWLDERPDKTRESGGKYLRRAYRLYAPNRTATMAA